MNRKLGVFIAAVAAVALTVQAADAESRKIDPRLKVISTGVGVGTTAATFALNDWHWKWDSTRHGITAAGALAATTIGCAALSPIVATAVLDRPLTYREAHVLIADCVIPIIGGWLVNEAYNNGWLWAPDEKPVRVAHHNKKKLTAKPVAKTAAR